MRKLMDIKGYWDTTHGYGFNDKNMWEGQILLDDDVFLKELQLILIVFIKRIDLFLEHIIQEKLLNYLNLPL